MTAAESAGEILKNEKAALDAMRERISAFDPDPAGDPFRLVLRGGYDFEKLYHALEQKGVFCECYDRDALIMIPRFGFTKAEAEKLSCILQELLPLFRTAQAPAFPEEKKAPERKISLRKALLSRGTFVKARDACGKIAGEVIGRYPPGNGLILPGEIITKTALIRSGKRVVRIVEEED